MTRMLTTQEVAQILNVTVQTVMNLVKSGRLPQPVRLSPKTTRWRAADLDAFLNPHQTAVAGHEINN